MNSIGGFKNVTLLFSDQVNVNVFRQSAVIQTSSSGLVLPVSSGKVSISSSDRGDGSFSHSADITLRSSGVDSALWNQLRQVNGRGCVLLCEDFDGAVWLLGDGVYPLRGTFDEQHGKAHADLHYYRLQLSAVCLHPKLRIS